MSDRSDARRAAPTGTAPPSELARRARACRNAHELPDIWAEARRTNDFLARRAVAGNTFTTTELLATIIEDPNVVIVHDAVRNLNIGTESLDRVLGINGSLPDPGMHNSSRWREVVIAAAWSPALSPAARRRLGQHPDAEVRTAIAFRPDLSDREVEVLISDDDSDVAAGMTFMLQRDPERFPELLRDLRNDPDADVARAAIGELPRTLHRSVSKQAHLIKGLILRRPRPAAMKSLDPSERKFRDRSPAAQQIGSARWPVRLAELVEEAIEAGDVESLRTAAANRNCGAETLDVLADVDDVYTVLNVVRNQRTLGATLDRIFELDPETRVPLRSTEFLAAAGSDPELRGLVRITWRHVEIAAARHLRLHPPLRRWLGREHYDRDSRVTRELAARIDLSDWELEEYGTHFAATVRQHVAKTLHDDPQRIEWLHQELLSDAHPFVRGYARGKSRAEILIELGDEAIAETKHLPDELRPRTNDTGPDFR